MLRKASESKIALHWIHGFW